jgi:glutathione S-transferase
MNQNNQTKEIGDKKLICQKISPFSRAARVILAEVKLIYIEETDELFELPIFIENEILSGLLAIGEKLMGGDNRCRASYENAMINVLPAAEKILQNRVLCFINKTMNNSKKLADGRAELISAMKCLNLLASPSIYLGERFSYADAVWASFISYMDYLGEIDWENFPQAKQWYSVIKSRPSFASVLQETIPGIKPSKHYNQIDF